MVDESAEVGFEFGPHGSVHVDWSMFALGVHEVVLAGFHVIAE